MANQFDHNPWFVDSVMASAYLSQVRIGQIIWTGQTALGDEVIILDKAGKIIWKAKADGPNDERRSGGIGWVHGLQVTQIDSGYLTIAI